MTSVVVIGGTSGIGREVARHFAGAGDARVNTMNVQPFVIWQLGGGTYLRFTPISTFDFENRGANIPFGFGIGQVVRVNKTVFNLFIEPQYSVFNHNFMGSRFQIMTGINTQF